MSQSNATTYLDTTISYEEFIRWGAPALEDLPLDAFRAKHFTDREALTVSYVLDLPLHPVLAGCAVLREDAIAKPVLHGVALTLATQFVERMKQAGTYVDFRSTLLLDTMKRWSEGQASDGEVASARALAQRAVADVGMLGEPSVSAVAALALAAAGDDPRAATLHVLRRATAIHGTKEDLAGYNRTIRDYLAQHAPRPTRTSEKAN